jgi:hypothetical protein
MASPWNPDHTVPAFIGPDEATAVCVAAARIEDSRLIAAAPEMAEVLARFIACFPGHDAGKELREKIGLEPTTVPVDQARDLLSRIRGEA